MGWDCQQDVNVGTGRNLKTIFRDTEVKLLNGRRYGLVGPNGQGKTTLMTLLASRKIAVPESVDMLVGGFVDWLEVDRRVDGCMVDWWIGGLVDLLEVDR
jgi:ATPase subunit of ABC transporter with duplicated ATPase domains